MKTTSSPVRIDRLFYAVSTSLLLATPVETFAYEWSQLYPPLPRNGTQAPELLAAPDQQLMTGPELFVRATPAGDVQRAGRVVGHNNLQSSFNGMRPLLGDKPRNAAQLTGESQGMYWSMAHAQGWHLNAVAVGSRIEVDGRGDTGQRPGDSGHAMTFSVEGGYPIPLAGSWVIESQAQLMNQQFFPGSQGQHATRQAFDSQPSWSGHVGATLSGRYEMRGMPLEPYVRTNVWYDFSNPDEVKLEQVDKISSSRFSTTVELGLGLVARVTPSVAMFVSADYSSDVDGNDLNGLIGSLGVRMRW